MNCVVVNHGVSIFIVMDDIARIAEELAHAVELTMDPRVPQQQRMEAYTACERFKETSPVCVQCGLYLAQQSNASHFVRHFGLQLMEHCVKYRWNQISQQEKLFIKVKFDYTRVTNIQKVGPLRSYGGCQRLQFSVWTVGI